MVMTDLTIHSINESWNFKYSYLGQNSFNLDDQKPTSDRRDELYMMV